MTKKILITGENSYVGNQLAEWLNNYPEKYEVIKVSVRDNKWKDLDFSQFGVIVHTAGLAHQKESNSNRSLYYSVNRDLTYEIAKKAKTEKVKHFIFLSSISVYGISTGLISKTTPTNPKTHYGKSKLEAEKLILTLENNSFKITIIRAPMIYGNGCKGNYQSISKFAKKTLIFPKINNERSMIYIKNLNEFIRVIIDDSTSGLYLPQNKHYVSTDRIVELINERVIFVKFLNHFLKKSNIAILKKIFGDLTIENSLSSYKKNYNIVSFEESIRETEKMEV